MRRFAAVASFILLSHSALAQGIDDGRAGVAQRRFTDSAMIVVAPLRVDPVVAPHRRFSAALTPFAPLVSAIVPGGGQLILGDDRFAAYAAVEVLSWWKYVKDTREQAAQERAFKLLARQVGRSNFSTTLPDGDWTYYETMRDWLESGVYSKSASGAVQPETDTSTFNGHQWDLALRTNPDFASALAQYERIAIKPDFRWSWRNAQLQYDIFKRTTFKRNDANYAAGEDLIVIAANHLISMVDAFATIRLRVSTDDVGRTQLGASLRW